MYCPLFPPLGVKAVEGMVDLFNGGYCGLVSKVDSSDSYNRMHIRNAISVELMNSIKAMRMYFEHIPLICSVYISIFMEQSIF